MGMKQEWLDKIREQELLAQKDIHLWIFIDKVERIEKEMHELKLYRFNHYYYPNLIITTLGPGVYIFFQTREIQYIGSSKEMRTRIRKHAKDRKRYNSEDQIITIGTMTWEDAKELEDRLVILIKPPRNRRKTLQGKGRY